MFRDATAYSNQSEPREDRAQHISDKRSVLLVSRTWSYSRCEQDFFRALAHRFCLTFCDFDSRPPQSLSDVADPDALDAVVFFVRHKELEAAPPMNWAGFKGCRVYLEWDCFQEFTSLMVDRTRMKGRWTEVYRRNEFSQFVCSGVRSAEHFREAGLPTAVLYKGFEPTRFFDLKGERHGLCEYGARYRSRMAMARTLRDARLPLDDARAPYPELNSSLNRFLGVAMTTMGARVRLGKLGRGIERLRPGTLLAYEPSPEIMGKHFESAGAGCAVITDWTPDLKLLGFVDGESVIVYEDYADLLAKARYYLDHPEMLVSVGRAGAAIVHASHTWEHRAAELEHLIFQDGGH